MSERSMGVEIVTIETPSLGDRSYLIVDGDEAAAVDPQRDIDRVLAIVDERGLHLTHVFETHIHNDYVTGGLELARLTGAAYVLAADEVVAYARTGANDGDEFPLGGLTIRAVRTPGHTPMHLSYVLAKAGTPVAVFTGGSLLYGTVGRTDLIGPDATDALTRAQFQSVRRLAQELPGHVTVHPTHGFGSFCSSTSTTGASSSTITQERATNLALTVGDEEGFVRRLLHGLTVYPSYYAHMAPINRSGPAPIDLSPPAPLDLRALRRRLDAGEWVVDLRSRKAFASGHLAGTVNLEVGRSFCTYLGWTLPWGTPVSLMVETPAAIREAQRQMARIGIDRPAGAAVGGLEVLAAGAEVRSYPVATFTDLEEASAGDKAVVLDVRRDDEWEAGHIDEAVHIALHDLGRRLSDVPPGRVWVHCASGYRASLAASLLARAGREVVLVDDDWVSASTQESLRVLCGR